LRHRSIGAENELLGLTGGYVPFAKTAEERQAVGDPRPALLERYRNFDDYRQQYLTAARKLVDDRYLLEEDLPRLEAAAIKNLRFFEQP
jgi:hypothetical protein